jgi:hypothetical protein
MAILTATDSNELEPEIELGVEEIKFIEALKALPIHEITVVNGTHWHF